jgi:hypothetical protein
VHGAYWITVIRCDRLVLHNLQHKTPLGDLLEFPRTIRSALSHCVLSRSEAFETATSYQNLDKRRASRFSSSFFSFRMPIVCSLLRSNTCKSWMFATPSCLKRPAHESRWTERSRCSKSGAQSTAETRPSILGPPPTAAPPGSITASRLRASYGTEVSPNVRSIPMLRGGDAATQQSMAETSTYPQVSTTRFW